MGVLAPCVCAFFGFLGAHAKCQNFRTIHSWKNQEERKKKILKYEYFHNLYGSLKYIYIVEDYSYNEYSINVPEREERIIYIYIYIYKS